MSVSTRVGKRLLLCWADRATLASDATVAFAFDDYFSMGVLTSRARCLGQVPLVHT